MHFIFLWEVAYVAQLKDTIIAGSLRVTDTTYTNNLIISNTTAPTIATNDYLVMADASDSNKLLKGPALNTSNTTKWLTQAGTWTTPTAANVGAAPSAGASTIVTVGTVTTGTWNATKINPNKGGTGIDNYAKGDILYAGAAIANTATTALSKLAIGTAGYFLKATANGPSWANTTDITALGTITTGTWSATTINPNKGGTGIDNYAKGDILYASKALTSSSTDALSKLSIGSNTAGYTLQVSNGIPQWVQTVAVANGGTGLTTATNKNAIITGNSTTATDAFTTVRTNNGAFYATAQDGVAQFGTLPIAQGGTGKTSALAAANNLGVPFINGVGTEIAANTNLNTAYGTTAGTYHSKDSQRSATLTGIPSTSSGFKLIHYIGYSTNWDIRQFLTASNIDLYYRWYNYNSGTNSAWTAWHKFVLLPGTLNTDTNVTTFSAIGTTTKPVYVDVNGIITVCSDYAGGTKVILNGTSAAASTADFYAPTASGTANHILASGGANTAPSWVATAKGAAYVTAANGALTFGTLDTAYGGTGATSFTRYGVIYANPATKLVSTKGNAGYLLQGNGSAAPSWIQATDTNTVSTVVKRNASGTFSAESINLSNVTPLIFYGVGSGTYQQASIQCNSNGIIIETPRATEDVNGTILPVKLMSRGGVKAPLECGAITTESTLRINPENNEFEGGQIILTPATSSYNQAVIDLYGSNFRLHNGTIECFKVDMSSGDTTVDGNILYVGSTTATDETDIVLYGPSGSFTLFSHASNGTHGLWAHAHDTAAGKHIFYCDADNNVQFASGSFAGAMTGQSTTGTTTSDATGAVLLCSAIASNTGIFNGNGDGNGTGTADLIIKSWYGIGFVDGCTNKGMTVGIDCRNGTITAQHVTCATHTAGNSYGSSGSAFEVREVNRVGNTQNAWSYAPKIGFHWSGVCALQLGMNKDQQLCLFNNSSNSSYGTIKAGTVYGAVWNDYAEMRNVPQAQTSQTSQTVTNYQVLKREITLAGYCVQEVGDDTMILTTERLQRGCKIISDTFGFNIGETDDAKTPVAVSGRVLAYCYEGRDEARKHIGHGVCSAPNGMISIMTEEEERLYPMSIIGIISAVPDYEEWGSDNILVNGRIWIYVK